MRIRLYIASLLLLGVFNVQAQYTTEVFATNVDGAGTDLRWYVYTPTTGGPPWPVSPSRMTGKETARAMYPANCRHSVAERRPASGSAV